jgi:hypothetical protein
MSYADDYKLSQSTVLAPTESNFDAKVTPKKNKRITLSIKHHYLDRGSDKR